MAAALSDARARRAHAARLRSMALEDTDAGVRELATLAVASETPPPPGLLAELAGPDREPGQRRHAVHGLARLAPDEAETCCPALAGCLRSDDRSLREHAAAVLPRFGAAAVPDTKAVLRGETQPGPRIAALSVLRVLGPDASTSRPGVEPFARGPDPAVRRAAQATLAAMDPGDSEAAGVIAAELDDRDAEARRSACDRLGTLGEAGAPHAPAIRRRLASDPDASVRAAAALALGRLGADSNACVDRLGTALRDDEDRAARRSAAIALSGFGVEAETARTDLEHASAHDEPAVAGAAGGTLRHLARLRATADTNGEGATDGGERTDRGAP